MANANKNGKANIPEPSFEFFLAATCVMLLLVIAGTVYFSVHA
jgi:hypothetical protein